MNGVEQSGNQHQGQLAVALVAVAVFATFIFGWRLNRDAFGNSDEGIHSVVTRAIVEKGDWLTLRFNDSLYFRKPPFSFWVRAVAAKLMGESEFSVRFPSALAGVLTTLLLAWWAWQWTRQLRMAAVVGFMYPLLPMTFLHTWRSGEADGILIFLLTLAAWLLWQSLRRPWLIVAAGAVLGLAFITKSVAAVVVPIGFGAMLLVRRHWPYRWPQVMATIGVFLAIILPWHIHQLVVHGRAFWNEYVGFHIVQRIEERLHTTPKLHGPLWYIPSVVRWMFPWSWLIVPAVAASIRRIRQRVTDRGLEIFLMAWALGTVALYTLAATKLAWYIAPAFPAMALLIGRLLVESARQWPRWFIVLTAIFGLSYVYDVARRLRLGLSGKLSLGFFDPWMAAAVVVIVLIAIFIIAGRRPGGFTSAVRWLWLALIAHMSLVSIVITKQSLSKVAESPHRVFRNSIEAQNPHANVYIFSKGIYPQTGTQLYLVGPNSQRTVKYLKQDPTALQKVVDQDRGAFVIHNDLNPPAESLLSKLEFVRRYHEMSLYRVP
ncbi:MAG: glycosyltransferase family 39 protein [Candidatus Kerfeldbacteria bacterium]|nr:glycosyltransferase family 39 protein [Candidatus Kerfeldbacteria bacterium]